MQQGKIKNIIESKIKHDTVLFFDLDGTLVETNLANFLAYRKAIRMVIGEKPNLKYNPTIRFDRNVLKNEIRNLSENDYNKIIQEKEKYFSDFLNKTKPIKATINLLNKYSQTNMTVLVTNCRKNRAVTTLLYHNLLAKFWKLFWNENDKINLKRNKYLDAINKLGIVPECVIAFEDDEHEFFQALSIGIFAIKPNHL